MEKMSKKRIQKFAEDFKKQMLLVNAVELPLQYEGQGLRYEVDTIYGKLNVLFPADQKIVPTIFAQFQELEKYEKFDNPRINSYSGKWNFHYFSPEECLEVFVFELSKIIN